MSAADLAAQINALRATLDTARRDQLRAHVAQMATADVAPDQRDAARTLALGILVREGLDTSVPAWRTAERLALLVRSHFADTNPAGHDWAKYATWADVPDNLRKHVPQSEFPRLAGRTVGRSKLRI